MISRVVVGISGDRGDPSSQSHAMSKNEHACDLLRPRLASSAFALGVHTACCGFLAGRGLATAPATVRGRRS
jgi:hypothetical protein